MSDNIEKLEEKANNYLNLEWSLNTGEDLDFEGKPYHYVEIREIPNFVFCAKTLEQAMAGYKRKLKLYLQVALEEGEEILKPGDFFDED